MRTLVAKEKIRPPTTKVIIILKIRLPKESF